MRRKTLLLLLEQQTRTVILCTSAVLLEQKEEAWVSGIFRLQSFLKLISLNRDPACCLDNYVRDISVHQRRRVWADNHYGRW